nr:MAG TPA_asm: hypothetical protein [Caudoviricetes sp.]
MFQKYTQKHDLLLHTFRDFFVRMSFIKPV